MDIHKLKPGVITKIRSSSTMSSITHCITELVLNSLDAKSSAIAIRINFVTFRIQLVDNGNGITKNNLILLGQRYMTNKCSSLHQTETHATCYGFHGEALANIINLSKNVEISSKSKNSRETWSRTFIKGSVNDVISVKDRPSCGTTVTIQDFLYNFPLRKKCIVPEVELFHVKRSIECLIIMHPHVTFSLRNDITGDLILNSQKSKNIISSFLTLHPEVIDEYSLIKVSKSRVTVKGLLFKQVFENNSMQYMYVNKRPIKCSKLQVFVTRLLQKNMKYSKETLPDSILLGKKHKHSAYVINITCPCSFVDILLSPKKSVVEFKNWDIVFRCIEKLVHSFFGIDKSPKRKSFINPKLRPSDCGISQIYGALKSYGFKRKNHSDRRTSTPTKIQKLTDHPDLKTGGAFSVDKFGEYFIESKNFSVQNSRDLELLNEKQNQNTNYISDFSYKNYHCEKEGSEGIENNPIVQKPKFLTKKHLHPLPVTVFNKNNPIILDAEKMNDSHILSKPIKECNQITNTDLCTKLDNCKLLQEKTFLSKHTYDENKGKNLIMDMFLKSTQVYNSEDESDDRSDNTIMEMESNYFLENNITATVNGKCKTMSVSVNITKKIKKKCKKRKQLRMTSKSVQTSLQQNKKMRTKYVQTLNTYPVYDTIIGRSNCSNKPRLVDNCTVILTDEVPYFKFINNDRYQLYNPEIFVEDINCNCKCHSYFLKSFNMNYFKDNITKLQEGNNFQSKLNEKILKNQTQTVSKFAHSDLFCEDSSSYFYNMTDRRHIQEGIYYGTKQDRSNNESNTKEQYSCFNPPHKSTQKSPFFGEECNDKRIKIKEHKTNEDIIIFHSSSSKVNIPYDISKISNLVIPEEIINYNSRNVTLCPKEVDSTVLCADAELHKMPQFKLRKKFQHKHCTDQEENLFITLSNQQKQEILKRELSIEKRINNINLEWESQIVASEEKDDINKLNEFGHDWIQKQNHFGNNFYINRRTGFSTFYTPKTSNKFKLNERIDFVPKGLSPILKEIKKVEELLSQNKKDKLELYIMESHQNELLKIKWQNYIKGNDPKTIFNEVYKEKLNSFENCIPRLCNNKKKLELNPLCFAKTLLNNITVIGPVDKKFIAALEKTNNLLILFDQHAVHERIRLEQLLERYSNATAPLHGEKFIIFLPCNDIAILRKHEQYMNHLGLHVTFFQNGINIVEIPLCIYNKFNSKVVSKLLNSIIEILIKEIINLIKETEGVTFKSLPRMIHDIINLEACRGAIKFGDIITKGDCEQLLKKLSKCNLPFQCAHGRPTLTPLLPLNFATQIISQKINFQNLFA